MRSDGENWDGGLKNDTVGAVFSSLLCSWLHTIAYVSDLLWYCLLFLSQSRKRLLETFLFFGQRDQFSAAFLIKESVSFLFFKALQGGITGPTIQLTCYYLLQTLTFHSKLQKIKSVSMFFISSAVTSILQVARSNCYVSYT